MKIAFIGQKGIPAKSGGVERHVEELAKRLAKKNHEVFIYVRNNYTDKEMARYKGITLVHLPNIPTKHLDAITHTFIAIVHALFRKYDIIHFHSIGPTSLSFLIKIFKRKTVLVATYHSQDYFHKKWGWFAKKYLYFSEFITCTVPDKTIVVSRSLLEYVKNKYGKTASYIPNGAQVRFNENFDRLSKWNLEKDGYILAVSRFVRHKGLQYLIEAYKSLADKKMTSGKKLVIVGDGFYTDDYVKYIKDLARGREDIIFTGARTGEDLDQLFSHCYFFVQPSESEGLSLALLEAMGYGSTVLVSDIPENMEAIEESGFSFKNKDVTDLEKGLAYLTSNPKIVEEYGEKAKKRIGEAYSWENIVDQIEAVYKNLLH